MGSRHGRGPKGKLERGLTAMLQSRRLEPDGQTNQPAVVPDHDHSRPTVRSGTKCTRGYRAQVLQQHVGQPQPVRTATPAVNAQWPLATQ